MVLLGWMPNLLIWVLSLKLSFLLVLGAQRIQSDPFGYRGEAQTSFED